MLYRIYAQGGKRVGLTASNTFRPSGSLGADPSCFRVTAVDAQGHESPWSNEVCANPVSVEEGHDEATRR